MKTNYDKLRFAQIDLLFKKVVQGQVHVAGELAMVLELLQIHFLNAYLPLESNQGPSSFTHFTRYFITFTGSANYLPIERVTGKMDFGEFFCEIELCDLLEMIFRHQFFRENHKNVALSNFLSYFSRFHNGYVSC